MMLNISKSRNVLEKFGSLIVRQVPSIVSMRRALLSENSERRSICSVTPTVSATFTCFFVVGSLFNNVYSITGVENTSSVTEFVSSLQLFQRYSFVFPYVSYSLHRIVGYCILNSIPKSHYGHSNYYRNIHSFVICIQRIIHYTGYFDSAFTVGFPSNM